jgi:hypothetical protein
MSVVGRSKAENICSQRVFRLLTRNGLQRLVSTSAVSVQTALSANTKTVAPQPKDQVAATAIGPIVGRYGNPAALLTRATTTSIETETIGSQRVLGSEPAVIAARRIG